MRLQEIWHRRKILKMKKMRFIIAPVIAALAITGCTAPKEETDVKSEAAKSTVISSTEETADAGSKDEEDRDMGNISAEQLIKEAGLSEDEYTKEELEDFIYSYDITSDNIKSLNIKALLSDYFDGMSTVGIFDGLSENTRKSDFTEDIVSIAFLENIGTSSECVYYDLEQGQKYRASDSYLFSDITKGSSESIENSEELISKLKENGMWELKSKTGGFEDGDESSMELAVFYSDGTCFNVKIDALSDNAPASYEKIRELLLG